MNLVYFIWSGACYNSDSGRKQGNITGDGMSATTTVNIQEAKTHLSRLISAAIQGEEVVIANRGIPAVRLEPVCQSGKRPLGFVKGTLPASFFDPLSDEELQAWGQ
jgi:prevent-host-death family protein